MHYNVFMPVIIRFKNLKFCIYKDDHGNAHVHVLGPGAEAKIYLDNLEVASSYGFSKKALGRIVKEVEANKELLTSHWEEWHDQE